MNKSNRTAIELHDVTKTYALGEVAVHALRGVSFSIDAGEYVAIMGPSGSGKSTLMNTLGCLDRPTTGQYILDGDDVGKLDDNALAAIRLKKLGFVFQGFNLLARTTAIKNVALPLFYAGIPSKIRNAAAMEQLREVGLGDRMDHKPQELSGGQQQRVAIARALINDPSILLADEPTGNLDSHNGENVLRLLRALADRGQAILMATHSADAAAVCDRTIRMYDGRIVP
jgi:putative ABC transport system ATP-binding protein